MSIPQDTQLDHSRIRSSVVMLVLLGLLVFVHTFGSGIYDANGLERLATFEFLYEVAFLCGVVWWLQAEVRRSAVQQVYCSGLLVGAGWFFIIPYHLLKTRGARGFIPLLALIGTFILAYILAVIFVLLLLPLNPP